MCAYKELNRVGDMTTCILHVRSEKTANSISLLMNFPYIAIRDNTYYINTGSLLGGDEQTLFATVQRRAKTLQLASIQRANRTAVIASS